jgi:protein-tyrosine phosphatase
MNLLAMIGKYGTATVIAAYLVWQMGESLPAMKESLVEVKAQQSVMVGQHEMLGDTLGKYLDLSVKLQRANCLNTAETKEERLNCNQ